LFAFSSENWNRPEQEVTLLMELFTERLQAETPGMVERNISLRVVGSRNRFPQSLLERIEEVELATAGGSQLSLQIAADYGGRWDIVEAARQLASKAAAGQLDPNSITEQSFCEALALSPAPDPDLLIRTGGEFRVSNFLLWQLAYGELYFTDLCWPDFDADEFQRALHWFADRSRRFGGLDDAALNVQAEAE
ncbi:MAG: di-trans,poly-cis-decaprenylcistransferase, partial [Immundisolibacteraceae bacterium]|nr:di-trans,poly-cis-decaprenylcistransferase [Immundisolibacteraceae bacterium]